MKSRIIVYGGKLELCKRQDANLYWTPYWTFVTYREELFGPSLRLILIKRKLINLSLVVQFNSMAKCDLGGGKLGLCTRKDAILNAHRLPVRPNTSGEYKFCSDECLTKFESLSALQLIAVREKFEYKKKSRPRSYATEPAQEQAVSGICPFGTSTRKHH